LKNSTKGGKVFFAHGIHTVKMSMLPQAIYVFSAMSTKIIMQFIKEFEKSILKFVWMYKRPQTP
jgi:hypothetical protein